MLLAERVLGRGAMTRLPQLLLLEHLYLVCGLWLVAWLWLHGVDV
jgi:hypothetical protein